MCPRGTFIVLSFFLLARAHIRGFTIPPFCTATPVIMYYWVRNLGGCMDGFVLSSSPCGPYKAVVLLKHVQHFHVLFSSLMLFASSNVVSCRSASPL